MPFQDSLDIEAKIAKGSRRFPACRTDEYLYSQLIPYIGNKRNLLSMLNKAIQSTGVKCGVFADLFAGSGVVSRLAKMLGYAVISNDWEPYCEQINRCWIECNTAPDFSRLGNMQSVFDTLNTLEPLEGYIASHLCPGDDENPDVDTERMFFTRANGMKIDAIREKIFEWEQENLLSELEKSVLLAPLIYAVSYTSNTSGVFKGFHRGWGGATHTALYRILSNLELFPPIFFDNNQRSRVFCTDASELAMQLSDEEGQIDIAYIDPPYNQHPYGSNYHVLNTVTLWDKPPLSRTITCKEKSAIRKDWRLLRRSAYHRKTEALEEYGKLLSNLKAHFVLTSYSTDGVMPLSEMLKCAGSFGRLEVVTRSYKRYRVSSQRMSNKPVNAEFVLIIDTSEASSKSQAAKIYDRIMTVEAMALSSHRESSQSSGE